MPRYLWIDTLKDNKTVVDLGQSDPAFVKEEFTHVAAIDKEPDHLLDVQTRTDLRGALIFFFAKDDDDAKRKGDAIPVIKRGYAEYELIRYENFVSVQSLFGQGGKYLGEPIPRTRMYRSHHPANSYWLILEGSEQSLLDDTAYIWRMKKGGVAKQVFNTAGAVKGFLVEIIASDDDEAMSYARDIPSVKEGTTKPRVFGTTVAALYDMFF